MAATDTDAVMDVNNNANAIGSRPISALGSRPA